VLEILQEQVLQSVEPVEQQKTPVLHNYDIEKLFPDHVHEKSLDDWLDGLKIKKDPILQLDDEKTKTKKTKKRAQQSLEEDETLVTETLAKLYVIQKKWDKAQKAYMALVHKFPERKAFFEEQMKEIETEIEKNKN
jgi:protein tyrosine/serine phosphatase